MADRPFRHLCPEADMRDAMSDAEFWSHVFSDPRGGLEGWEPDPPTDRDLDDLDLISRLGAPCRECGQVGACGYDAEGRVLVHPEVDTDGD